MATMESAIRSGRPQAVDDSLREMSDSEGTEQLKKTYGGGDVKPDENTLYADENGLFLGTSPLLHAASSGQSALFSAVVGAMRDRQLEIPLSGDVYHRTVLSLAARSGSKDTFKAVLSLLLDELDEVKVKDMIMGRDKANSTVLMEATKSGNKDTFEAALDAAKTHALREVSELIASKDDYGDTVVSAAVKWKEVDLLQAVLHCVQEDLRPIQVTALLASRCLHGCSLMMGAAASGSVSIWVTVIGALHRNLETDQVTAMMTEVCGRGFTLLVYAANGGSSKVWNKVMIAVRERVPDEVKPLLRGRVGIGSKVLGTVLKAAAASGDHWTFQEVLATLQMEFADTETEVDEMMLSTDTLHGQATVLMAAVYGGNEDTFEEALKVARARLTSPQVLQLLSAKDTRGDSLLSCAVKCKNVGLVKLVVEAVVQQADEIQESTVLTDLLKSQDKLARSVLHDAALSGSVKVWTSVVNAFRDSLPSEQVQEVMASMFQSQALTTPTVVAAAASRRIEDWIAVVTVFSQHLFFQRFPPEQVGDLIRRNDELFLQSSAVDPGARDSCLELFETVLACLSNCLNTQQVHEVLMAKSSAGDTELVAAASSGDMRFVRAMISCLKEHLTTQQVQSVLIAKSLEGESLQGLAARLGNIDFFAAMASCLTNELATELVQELLLGEAWTGRSVLVAAAGRADINFFKAIIACLTDLFTREKVQELLMAKNVVGKSLFVAAAEPRDAFFFNAMVTFLKETLTLEQVQEIIVASTTPGRQLLLVAARAGDVDFFRAMITCLEEYVTSEQVQKLFMRNKRIVGSLLVEAARPGDIEDFRAMMTFLSGRLTRTQAEEMVCANHSPGEPLMLVTARAGSVDFFRAMITCLKEILTSEQVNGMIMANISAGEKLLPVAARSGDVDFFRALITCLTAPLTSEQGEKLLMDENGVGINVLVAAAGMGDIEFFRATVNFLKQTLSDGQVKKMLMTKNGLDESVLLVATRLGDISFFKGVITFLKEQLTNEQVTEILLTEDVHGYSWSTDVVRDDGNKFFSAMITSLPELLTKAQVNALIFTKFNDQSLLDTAFNHGDAVLLSAFLECMEYMERLEPTDLLEAKQVAATLDLQATVSACVDKSLASEGGFRRVTLQLISYFTAHYVRPHPDELIKLSRSARQASDEYFKTCCLRAVTSAANPFIPGISLSVGLAVAAEMAQEGEKRSLISLQKNVDNLLLEVLERLPQTVRGFDRGMEGCCAVFEPERMKATDAPSSIQGPLGLALEQRQQTETFCNVPLVMDFLSRRFTRGLPNLRDTNGVLRDPDELRDLREGTEEVDNGLVLNRPPWFESSHRFLRGRNAMVARLLSPSSLLQGANFPVPSLTWLPGAQFVVAGLVAKPRRYYTVPAMRMLLDLVVYLGMLAVFSKVVLFRKDGALIWGESIVAAYIVSGCLREGRDMSRGIGTYFEDRWNVIDVLALVLLTAGLVFRAVDTSGQWSHALYALSAPLLFLRILFFAQILPFQGPMIEVIFSMTAELFRFGIVMAVVMIGFAVSFHALFRDDDSFGVTLLDLFKAMLGEVGFFDDFSGGSDDVAATILLVVYLVIITIMLLNLLVAILSTSHARVQENVEREFRVSKARIIQHYRLVVEKHLLPAPLNLVQLVVSLPCRVVDDATYVRVKEAVGRLLFGLVLGPLAVAAGAFLWMTSVFTFTFGEGKGYSQSMTALVLQARNDARRPILLRGQDESCLRTTVLALTHVFIIMWCLVVAPLCLLSLWFWHLLKLFFAVFCEVFVRWLCKGSNALQLPPPLIPVGEGGRRGHAIMVECATNLTIEDMLKHRAGGVGAAHLSMYLNDPMIDLKVREDEKKRGVTVEHLKLLRNRLEDTLGKAPTTTNERLDQLQKDCRESRRERAELKDKLDSVLSAMTPTKERFGEPGKERTEHKQERAQSKHGRDSVLTALNTTNERLEQLEKECAENQQGRAESNGKLDSVLRAVDGMRHELVAIASRTNPSREDELAPDH